MLKFLLLLLSAIILLIVGADTKAFIETINSAKTKTDEILNTIYKKWQIKDYPNFLKSVGMTHTGKNIVEV